MTGHEEEPEDWIVIQSVYEDTINKTLEYLQNIWSTKIWVTKSNVNDNWIMWARCNTKVLCDIRCKAIAFRDGWNEAKIKYGPIA